MSYYNLKFTHKAKEQYEKLDKSVRHICDKKILQLKDKDKKRRHLRFGESYFVEEVGQFRIVYEIIEEDILILILFIGKHKKYDDFLGRVKEVIEEYEKNKNTINV